MGQSIVFVCRSTKASLAETESVIVLLTRRVKLSKTQERHMERLRYAKGRHLKLQMLNPTGLRGRRNIGCLLL